MATIQIAPSKDTDIRANAATTNYGTDTVLNVGDHSFTAGTGQAARALIHFDLSSIPSGSIINSATLYLYHSNRSATNTRTMSVYRIIRLWNETQATWNIARTGTNWGTAGAANTSTDYNNTVLGSISQSSTEADGWKAISLTASVIQSIYEGSLTYEGFLICMATENDDRHMFSSREGSNAPYLEIDYTPPGAEFQVVFIG